MATSGPLLPVPDIAALLAQAAEPLASRLPADLRARLVCTNRALRASEPLRDSFLRLDLSRNSGVAVKVTDEVLLGTAALVRGTLEALDVRGTDVSAGAVAQVVDANAATLRELYLDVETASCADMTALLTTAPRLCALEAATEEAAEAHVVALLHALAQPRALTVSCVRLSRLNVLAEATTRALMALQAVAALETGEPLPPLGPAPLCVAFSMTQGGAAALELTGTVELVSDAIVAALAALVAADTPALREVYVDARLPLSETQLGALLQAVARNTHLHILEFRAVDGMNDTFAQRWLLPALAGNSSLRELRIFNADELPALHEAVALVNARGGA